MSEPINPVAVMARHDDPNMDYRCWCQTTSGDQWPCEPYRLAEALAAEQAKTARVAELAHRFELIPRARLLGALTAKAKS